MGAKNIKKSKKNFRLGFNQGRTVLDKFIDDCEDIGGIYEFSSCPAQRRWMRRKLVEFARSAYACGKLMDTHPTEHNTSIFKNVFGFLLTQGTPPKKVD